MNRRELSASSVGKTSKWPRTCRRQERIAQVLRRRQPDLTLVLENVHDPHNVSSVLRACDAVGVLRVHLIYSAEEPPARAFARTTSASAAKWVETVRHATVDDCYRMLRQEGFSILATAFEDGARDLYDVDFRRPTALAFGNEMRGLTEEAIAGADGCVVIPMLGMVQSLNISVACAVTLYEALRQRRQAGDYATAKLPEGEREQLAEAWLKK
ncbi:MAG TPA: RNA methyltransferase [Thermomicrobiales bacterium]|nr:RNA methyltransferase [Thermomicrobiales bacterium]